MELMMHTSDCTQRCTKPWSNIHHKFGISTNYNTFTAHPWHGAGQGAADAALRYIVLSNTLIDAYHTKVVPTTMTDPMKNLTILCSLKAFIDNVVLHASANPPMTYETLKQQAQDQLQWWNKLVKVMGGSLNHKKCCTITYHWTPDRHGILTLSTPNDHNMITLKGNNNPQPITNIPLNQGTQYLGLYITGDRNTKPMEQNHWQKALKYTATFQRTPMSQREATVLYRSCFLPALTYPLLATWLPYTFFDKVHWLSTSVILNKMGYHKSLPRSLVFAPKELGRLGLCHLQHEMEAQQILLLIWHIRANTLLGIAIGILINYYQLWAGLASSVMNDTRACEWIPDCWLSRIRCTLHENNIQIHHDFWKLPKLQQNDSHLMEVISEFGLTTAQLWQVNACCMYLQVTTLAKITDHTGTTLLMQAISTKGGNPQQLQLISYSLLTWPAIHRPATSCWKLWNNTIRKIFTGSTNSNHLTKPLGAWCVDYQTHQFWPWQYSPAHRILHKPNPQQSPWAALIMATKETYWTISATIPTNLSFEGPPITPTDTHWHWINLPISSITDDNQIPPPPRAMQSISEQLQLTLKPWQKPLIGPVQKLQPATQLCDLCWHQHPILIISNASVQKTKQSGFAWVIAQDDQSLWKGVGLAPGTADNMYSGRAEAFGLLAALLFLIIIITQRFYRLKVIVCRSFLTFPMCQTYGKMMSCQGPMAEVVRRVSSVSAFPEKKAVAQMGFNSQGGAGTGCR